MKKILALALIAVVLLAAGCGPGDAGTVDSNPNNQKAIGANSKTGKGGAMENDNGLYK